MCLNRIILLKDTNQQETNDAELPLDINSFEQIRSHNGIYVDKTEHIYKLISAPSQYYFLSRPARFGKSLLLSTLQEIFLGKRHLFDNLWIGTQSTYTWTAYPVISLDFSEPSEQPLTRSRLIFLRE